MTKPSARPAVAVKEREAKDGGQDDACSTGRTRDRDQHRVFFGHVLGRGISESWTEAVGISETAYHVVALTGGWLAGLATVVGLVMLIYHRHHRAGLLGQHG